MGNNNITGIVVAVTLPLSLRISPRSIAHAGRELGATALFAGHSPSSDASGQLLQKLGFHYERDEFYAPTGLQHPSYFLELS